MNEEDYQRRIAELEQQLQELNNRYQYLEEQFRIAQQRQFGKICLLLMYTSCIINKALHKKMI